MAGKRQSRILEATAKLVAEHGYLGFTLKDLLPEAGVGLVTVRKHFGDKEGCYLALFDRAAAEAERRCAEAFAGERGSGEEKVGAAVRALFELIAAHPEVACACLVEQFAAGPAAIGRYGAVLRRLAAILRGGRDATGEQAEQGEMREEELGAAVLWLPTECLLAGEAERIPRLAAIVAEFVVAPDIWGGERLDLLEMTPERERATSGREGGEGAAEPLLGPLPSGKHKLPREVVVRSQRERLLAAAAETVAERGYGAVIVSDIVRRARVSRRSFYVMFEGKEECVLAAWEVVAAHLRELVLDGATAARCEVPQKALAGLGAVLGFLAAEPGLARFCMVECLAAGAVGQRRYREAIDTLATALRASLAESLDGPAAKGSEEMAVGSTAMALSLRIATAGVEDLPSLEPELVGLLLGPFSG
jgi:AcrR family transcriptional regulator